MGRAGRTAARQSPAGHREGAAATVAEHEQVCFLRGVEQHTGRAPGSHQEAIWARQQATGRLRSLLQEFYPQALATFPNLTHRAAAVILRAAPTPQAPQRLTPRRVAALLQQAGRRNDPGLAEWISTTLRAPALRQPTPVEHALGLAATGLIEIITAMSSAVHALERELAQQFDQHA